MLDPSLPKTIADPGDERVRRMRLFAFGVLVQASFGVLALVVTRWGFRSWPTGSYTWIPGLIAVTGLLVLVLLYRALSARGLPFLLLVASWFIGRVAGALASALVTRDGIDAGLVATATFGLVVIESDRLAFGTPALPSALLQLAILGLAFLWGQRSRRPSGMGAGDE